MASRCPREAGLIFVTWPSSGESHNCVDGGLQHVPAAVGCGTGIGLQHDPDRPSPCDAAAGGQGHQAGGLQHY